MFKFDVMEKYHVWGAMREAILKPSSEAQHRFWIKKFALKKVWDNFRQMQLTKLSRVLEIAWQSTRSVMEDTEHFCLFKKCSHLRCLRALVQLRKILITSQLLGCR